MVYYYRRIILGVLLGLIILLVPALNILADDPEVDITVSAFIVGTPSGLILTYVSDYEVGIEWTKGEDAANTMIRGAVGRVPESRTDGYLVYYGDGTSASDTGVSLDETAAAVYYRAWSQNAAGSWEEEGISNFIEGVGMTLIFLGVLGLGLLGMSFAFKQMLLAFMAGFVFIGISVLGWTTRTETYDIYGVIAIIGIVLVLVSFVCGFLVQHKAAEEDFRGQQRYDRDFPPEQKLTEEEAYSKLLDEEIGESAEEGAARRAKAVRKKYRAMMDR